MSFGSKLWGRSVLVGTLGVAVLASSVGFAAPAGATPPPAATLAVTDAGGNGVTTATPGAQVTATTTSNVTRTGTQDHTLVSTWDKGRVALTGTPAAPDGWPLDYSTDGGTSWSPTAPTELGTVNGVRARGTLTASAIGDGQALAVSNESSQWFTTNGSSSFNASSSGDGWSTFFDESRVFNIHHHNDPNSIDCHQLTDGSVCAGFPIDLSDDSTYFNTSARPDGWVDLTDHHLWFPTSDAYTGQVGFACVDVSGATPALCATPFVELVSGGASQDNPIDFARVGSKLYTTDTDTGQLLCLDAAANSGAGAPCADQPYAGFGSTDSQGALIAVGSNVYAYDESGANTITCFDTTANAACTGWTPPVLTDTGGSARPILAVPDSSGAIVALCLIHPATFDANTETNSAAALECFAVADGSPWSPSANLAAAVSANAPGSCCGTFYASAQTAGTKMFWPVSTNGTYAACFDVVKDAVCANWPQPVDQIYTTRVDPYNPLCLFTNGNDGVVRSWDVNTGQQAGCGMPPTGDMTADFASGQAAPQLGCSSGAATQGFHALTLNTPTSGFDSATLTVETADGSAVEGWTDVPLTPGQPLDLTALSSAGAGAAPTFHVTLHNVTTWVAAPDLTVSYTTGAPQLCVPLQVLAPCPSGSGLAASATVPVDATDISSSTVVTVAGGAPATTALTSTLSATSYDGPACFGTLSGQATLPGSVAVPGATVQLTSGSTVLATTQTATDGGYSFALVYPGDYNASFGDVGYDTAPAPQAATVTGGDTTTTDAGYTPPPPGPAPDPLTSTGVGTAPQQSVVTIPASGSVTLLDAAHAPATHVVTTGGSFDLDPATGTITFTPLLGYVGSASSVTFRATDAYAQSGSSTYTPTVTAPAAPTAADLASTGTAAAPQHADVTVPTAGSVTLLDSAAADQTTVTQPSGTYLLDPATGRITFAPILGFQGVAPAVRYRVTDAYGQTASGNYTPTVNPPGGPSAAALTSIGVGTARHSVTVTLPTGGSLRLLDGATLVASLSDATGRYAVVGAKLTFAPVLGFQGTAPGARYRVTDAYAQTADATYTPTVTPPAGPRAQPLTSTGTGSVAQTVTTTARPGDTVTLIDLAWHDATTVTVPAEGTYALTGATITFTPQDGFSGMTSGLLFQLRDVYGQTSVARYTPTVLAPPAPPAPTVTVGQNGTGTVSADCALPGRLMDSCTIVLTATVNGRTVVIGTGRLTSPGGGSSGGEIVITMTPVGNRLMHRPGGVTVTAVATITPHGTAAVQRTSRASLRAKALLVPVVHFATASAVVPASAVKSLKALRGKLLAAGASAVTCAGYTDARDTAAYNRSLGLSRARTVCAILTKGTAVRAVTLSFGPSHPVASNATPAGRAANRRVTLQLTY